jgi:hypothetical protein
VKVGSISCRNGRELFTAFPLVYPLSVTERK